MLPYEEKAKQNGFNHIIGIDEAGRGPLAGPVVASAVVLKNHSFQTHITDSKRITPLQREKAFQEIYDNAYVGIGIISESVIDEHNILNATFLAMRNAVDDVIAQMPLNMTRDKNFVDQVCLLIDGNRFKTDLPYHYQTIVKGDSLVLSIACASIIAKVIRDRILTIYDKIFPEYGFKKHKGYPTAQHRQIVREIGPSLIHRKSFKCV